MGTPWWYKTSIKLEPTLSYNKEKERRRHEATYATVPAAFVGDLEECITDIFFGSSFVFAMIQVGIITHQHRTDLIQTEWQNAVSGESAFGVHSGLW